MGERRSARRIRTRRRLGGGGAVASRGDRRRRSGPAELVRSLRERECVSAGGHSGTRAVFAALGANVGIAVMKTIGFVVTGSGAMLAEAVHSVADSGNQGLLLLGHRKSRREPDEERPFGYGRERFFWAFVVA